jgi:predicted transposase YdaD
MRIIHQPTDKLFKQTLSDSRVAREFFEAHLPSEILQQLDLTTLTLENHSFIDEAYKATEADIVYSVRQNDTKAYLYLLCENQSNVDREMAFRMLVYKVRLMELHVKKYPNTLLPMVYSIVVYTGKKPWDAPFELVDLMDVPRELAKRVLEEPYQLIDVHRIDDDVLRQKIWSGLVEFALKYRKVHDFAQFLTILFPWLEQLSQQSGGMVSGGMVAKNVLHYVAYGMKTTDRGIFLEKVDQYLSSELKGEAMTLAQQFEQAGFEKGMTLAKQFEQAGFEKGIQKGIHAGEASMLTRLLTRSFREIPPQYQKRIEAADGETLLRWGERVLDAKKLDDVFD